MQQWRQVNRESQNCGQSNRVYCREHGILEKTYYYRLRKPLKKGNAVLWEKLERMNELLLNAQRIRFGQSSDKQAYVMKDSQQLVLFNEAEAKQDPKAASPRKKKLR